MELKEKLNKKELTELYTLKGIVDSISNKYAQELTDYALISGNPQIDNDKKKVLYEKRMKYKTLSLTIEDVIIKKIDELLC